MTFFPGISDLSKRLLFSALMILVTLSAAAAEPAALERHIVEADGHPMVVWEKRAQAAGQAILLVHGRTWSALPDFDLQVEGEDLSLMDGLVEAGYAVYAVDLRGYGETPRDATQWLTPNRAADDVGIILAWISSRDDWEVKPHLFGWSMGSTVSQLAVQRHPNMASSLTLFGYWRDDDVDLAVDAPDIKPAFKRNTAEAAASDFITPGSISQKAIDAYVAHALRADPIRVDVRQVDQYNALEGAQITVPVLVISGEYDPIAPADVQLKLISRFATGHKQWVSVPGGDHAAFLESSRDYFLRELVAFLRGVSAP